jgi:hypothetical protein
MSIIKFKTDAKKGPARKNKPSESKAKVPLKKWSRASKELDLIKKNSSSGSSNKKDAKKEANKIKYSKKGEEDVDAEEFETVGIDFKQEEEFEEVSDESEEDDEVMERHDKRDKKDIEMKIQANNRKGSKTGGFQSMGLSPNVFKAITHKGYKIPTPIQRKVFLLTSNISSSQFL